MVATIFSTCGTNLWMAESNLSHIQQKVLCQTLKTCLGEQWRIGYKRRQNLFPGDGVLLSLLLEPEGFFREQLNRFQNSRFGAFLSKLLLHIHWCLWRQWLSQDFLQQCAHRGFLPINQKRSLDEIVSEPARQSFVISLFWLLDKDLPEFSMLRLVVFPWINFRDSVTISAMSGIGIEISVISSAASRPVLASCS